MKRLKINLWISIFCVLLISSSNADYYQTPPGEVTSDPGSIQTYQPPQPQNIPPEPSSMVPSYQDPKGDIEINPEEKRHGLEECKVIAQDGSGMIKEYMADSGPNAAGDPDAWIWVPLGMCSRINAGDYQDVPTDILNKINY